MEKRKTTASRAASARTQKADKAPATLHPPSPLQNKLEEAEEVADDVDDDGSDDDAETSGGRRLSMFNDGVRKNLFGSLVSALIGFGKARTVFSYAPCPRKHGRGAQHAPTYQ